MHSWLCSKADPTPHDPAGLAKATLLLGDVLAALLLDLVGLLARLLFPLVPVLHSEVECIMHNLQLSADPRLHRLDQSLWTLCFLVLILVCVDNIHNRLEGELFELVGVFLDNGDALLELRKGRVAKLVCAGQVRRDVGVRCLEVGVKGCDEGVVGVVKEGEGLGAVGVGLVELD